MRRNKIICAALAALVASVAILSWPHASADLGQRAGIGETILVVVADVVAPEQAGARLAELNAPFGELDGFHIDATDGYDVRAALVQTSGDLTRIPCPSVGAIFKETIEGVLADLECPADVARVDVLQPVGLTYVAKQDFASFAFGTCGAVGVPPCQRDRFRELFGIDLRFVPELSLIATAFRTKAGAQEFLEFARAAGVTGLITVQAHKVAGGDIGLGQEPHPDGLGPLETALDDQEAFQR